MKPNLMNVFRGVTSYNMQTPAETHRGAFYDSPSVPVGLYVHTLSYSATKKSSLFCQL